MKKYVITGASGHVGFRIADQLLDRDANVKVIARNREKLIPLVAKGARAMTGSLMDTAFLAEAFDRADAVFTMIPPDLYAENVRDMQTRIGVSIAEAIRKTGVKWVVNLSSQGAHLLRGTGPIAGLHEQEERLNAIPEVNVVHLRPTFFMENLESNIPLIRNQGIMGSPLNAEMKIPVIATQDIARAAVEWLSELRFKDKSVCDLLGQRDLSVIEMTGIIGKAIGKPGLGYVQFTYEAARNAMLAMKLSPDMARLFIEMYEAFNEGRITKGLIRTIENTTDTAFEDYAEEFARIYSNKTSEGKEADVSRKDPSPSRGEKSPLAWWHQLHLKRKVA
ncbi:MAG: NmrA family NAD(P)-binding protein [bacterium]